jgi:anti-anti-sigma regulatory factor
VLSANNAERLAQRISESLARSKNHLVLDLKKLRWDNGSDLKSLRDKLANYR